MIEITTKAYTFNELSKEAQATVIDNNRDFNTEYFDWYEDDYIYHKEQLEKAGFTDIDISFSGFSSQGDGASFTGKVCDLVVLNKAWKLGLKDSQAKVIQDYATITLDRVNHHYVHSNTVSVNIEYYHHGQDTPRLDELLNKLEKNLDELVKDYADTIYSDLGKTYDGMTSDEAIAESIEANELLFSEDGRQTVHLR